MLPKTLRLMLVVLYVIIKLLGIQYILMVRVPRGPEKPPLTSGVQLLVNLKLYLYLIHVKLSLRRSF
jgi:hypothetical protein